MLSMPLGFSVTDYRKQRHRKSRLKKTRDKNRRIENQQITIYVQKRWPEENIWNKTYTLLYSILITKESGSLLYMLASIQSFPRLYFRASFPLATEGLRKGDELSTASTVSWPKCSNENGSDSETTNQLLHLKLVTETKLQKTSMSIICLYHLIFDTIFFWKSCVHDIGKQIICATHTKYVHKNILKARQKGPLPFR